MRCRDEALTFFLLLIHQAHLLFRSTHVYVWLDTRVKVRFRGHHSGAHVCVVRSDVSQLSVGCGSQGD